MSNLTLVLIATGVIAGTGVLALLLFRVPRVATSIAVVGALVGGAVGLWAVVAVLLGGFAAEVSTPWAVPGGGMVVGIDPLSAFFLAPLFVLGALCAVYGRSYLGPLVTQAAELNLLLAAMALVLVARHGLLFLVAWETMTLLAYLLVTFDHGEAEVRRAGWVYLIASHVAVVALFALFLALGTRTGGSLDFASFADAWRISPSGAWGILALALVGFGVKAGIVGLHVWLPEAHAAAPSHVSALMSAVLIKLGLYGILRMTLLVSPVAWFGAVLMLLGVIGALLGIALALNQRDLKRILAYSSVENIGIVLIGMGLGFWAQARGDALLSAIGFAGGFLHIWNHAAMKGLMFLGAGSVLHSTGTKDVERLGGLLVRMRWTGRAMILGSVAIAGLPPLNGFTGEWLLYRGLTQVGVGEATPSNLLAMGGAAALALVGGLAVLCFVRLVGVVLLGAPRGDGAAHAHESPAGMTAPMWILAAVCIAGAVTAPILVLAQTSVVTELYPAAGLDIAATSSFLAPLVVVNVVLFCVIALAMALVAWRVDRTRLVETWGCGYAAPTPRMQYSARGFSEFLTARALPRWLRGQMRVRPPEGTFPSGATFASDMGDPLTRGIYEPLLVRAGHLFARLRFLQQGNLHVYLIYVLAAVVGGLTWVAVRNWSAW
ncbi:MAG TPA: proton-conducting transporter membrane subunit [Candidatus Krumholzibacteria bacterium]